MSPAIDVSGLVKHFGSTRALDGLMLRVRPGEVHGFLGPNGAGKTTTLRILLGLTRAESGTVQLLEGDPWRDAADLHHRLAYVPADVTLWPRLSGGEIIDLLARMRGGDDRLRRAELVDRFDLDLATRGGAYSTGNRQKVALVAALAADTELLVLDEPTSGLDPLMEEAFRRTIFEERDRGRTVLLSSHILSEVEALCDHVTIVRAGRTVETGSLAELRQLSRVMVTADVRSSPEELADMPGVHEVSVDGSRVHLQVDSGALTSLCDALAHLGVRDLAAARPTLEELFLRHYVPDTAVPAHGREARS
ncbi:ABC transporter ATP-binding protein [Brachybacterium sacelli]|uniref:ABC-2 type transport system ATP-binding protein n=1 Tax=Brachybacterium sacelli TaxID=173364 RepID=A0ABS4X2A2_9MICO|nr:ABC transporter ATP-binding protein [Brachybacterium sacelli]MBP2382587.1 ABC-2 type transport system ATP-binding protein [Brachybacterium sacelli]